MLLLFLPCFGGCEGNSQSSGERVAEQQARISELQNDNNTLRENIRELENQRGSTANKHTFTVAALVTVGIVFVIIGFVVGISLGLHTPKDNNNHGRNND
ncbi:MAG: hypothetical protein ACRC2T_13430 [Thermoguttaceae bacterium]